MNLFIVLIAVDSGRRLVASFTTAEEEPFAEPLLWHEQELSYLS